MDYKYSSNKNVQMLVSLLKANNIRKVVISPGSALIAMLATFQNDDYFEKYSAIDERGAAYIATGLAMESGEPVVIACTGATASRNYLPGLSEAYHRKLPIIAITGSQDISATGHLSPQFIDRSEHPKDTVGLSVHLQSIKDANDEWDCNVKINKALLEVRRDGGKPVHINFTAGDSQGLIVDRIPETRVIRRYMADDILPVFPENVRVAVTVGGHKPWSTELTSAVECFCEEHNAVVLIDHSSNYHGKYGILPTIATSQEKYTSSLMEIDLLIHIGEESGDYYTYYGLMDVKEVWRVSPDGEIRDTFKKLSNVFEMSELRFFNHYCSGTGNVNTDYYSAWTKEIDNLYARIPELPFSNIWLAGVIANKLPKSSAVHLGVSNTQRAWTFYPFDNSILSTANVGCRGIDGALSSALGMSFANPERIHYCILGDLTFFYDMNTLGNRSVGNNLRILLINNGGGGEFNMYSHSGYRQVGNDVNKFIAGSGHYGALHPELVRKYAEGLNYMYLSAKNKEEVLESLTLFLDEKLSDRPIIFEVFTNFRDESDALATIRNLVTDERIERREMVKKVLGDNGVKLAKKILGRGQRK